MSPTLNRFKFICRTATISQSADTIETQTVRRGEKPDLATDHAEMINRTSRCHRAAYKLFYFSEGQSGAGLFLWMKASFCFLKMWNLITVSTGARREFEYLISQSRRAYNSQSDLLISRRVYLLPSLVPNLTGAC